MKYKLIVDTKDPIGTSLEWFWREIDAPLPMGTDVQINHVDSDIETDNETFVVDSIDYSVENNTLYIWAGKTTKSDLGYADDMEELFRLLGFDRGDESLWR